MEVMISAAISIDGYLDDNLPGRLKLSSPEDWEAVARLRAECDAILVGANTVRKDNPSLVIKDDRLRKERAASGLPEDITKVTVTSSGNIDPASDFFTKGAGWKIVFYSGSDASFGNTFGGDVTVIRTPKTTASLIVEALQKLGIEKLMVEGGQHILSMFLTEGIADHIRLAMAPFFVGDSSAPRLPVEGRFYWNKDNRLVLEKVENLGGTAVMHFASQRAIDLGYMSEALDEARKSTPCATCYCVGAIVVAATGNVYKGYTHETSTRNHAEEEAIIKAEAAGETLKGAVIYSTMEPCSSRSSKPVSCSQLIIEKGFSRAVYAAREPDRFVKGEGDEILRAAGVQVSVLNELAGRALEIACKNWQDKN